MGMNKDPSNETLATDRPYLLIAAVQLIYIEKIDPKPQDLPRRLDAQSSAWLHDHPGIFVLAFA